MGNNVSKYYNEIGVVCPPQLRTGLFVTAAADNIDFNPSSSTSVGSFHGTGLSLFQNRGESDVSMMTNNSFNTHIEITKGQRHIGDLPDTYTNIKPTKLPTGDIFAPSVSDMCISKLSSNNESIIGPECEITADEFSWLRHVDLSKMDEVTKDATLSWSAYHASRSNVTQILPSINAILPLFSEEATSPAMLRHSMDIVNAAVQHINPGQTPVITVDQPLFAKIKQIQWSMPSNYGEDKFVIMLGGFHIELTLFKTLGSWLKDSGWVQALINANVASSGTADSFLKATHVLKTRKAHQVTASALYALMKSAYEDYVFNYTEDDTLASFNEWVELKKKTSPQFLYWYTVLDIELLTFTFIHSLREGDFNRYLQVLPHIIPWFFSLNHTHYQTCQPPAF